MMKEAFEKLGIVGLIFAIFGAIGLFKMLILHHYKDLYWFGPSLGLGISWFVGYAWINEWW